MFWIRRWLLLILICPIYLICITPDAQQALNFFEQINGDTTSVINKFYRATMLCELHEYRFSLQLYDELLTIMPNSLQILYNKAYVLKMIGDFKAALPLYRSIIANDPNHQTAHIGLSHVLLHLGMFQEGFKELEWRLANKYMRQKTPINLAMLKNKTVLLCCESGLGDQIQCIRYAQLLKEHGAYVIAQTYDALVPLMSRCPFVDEVVTQEQKNVSTDFMFCYFSLPLVCNTINENSIPRSIPYFTIDNNLIDSWGKTVSNDKNFKIGLSWHSKVQDTSFEFSPYRKRSIPLKKFESLIILPHVSFYSLQQITGLQELKNLSSHFNIKVFDTDFDLSNGRFMDTAALMLNLDLVITIDSAVAHLAGSLGIKTWLLLPAVADWRWQYDRTDSVWYPTMRLFRQKHAGNWDEVIEEIKQALKQLLRNY